MKKFSISKRLIALALSLIMVFGLMPAMPITAMASDTATVAQPCKPLDVMIVLDLSSSMYDGATRSITTVSAMINAVNSTITQLQEQSANNRVGVTVYFGGAEGSQSTKDSYKLLLPLDRYTHASNKFLRYTTSSAKLNKVAVNSNVKNEAERNMSDSTYGYTVPDDAGAFTQQGVLSALQQFLAADTTVPETATECPGEARVPVMILMADGAPTAATHDYTNIGEAAGIGDNTEDGRSPDAADFVTQLTLSYAKEMIDAHYEEEPIFYTLSLGTNVSYDVMDPSDTLGQDFTPSAAISGYWDQLLANGSIEMSATNYLSKTVNYTVSGATITGETLSASKAFPYGKSQQQYVDKAFVAETASNLSAVFENILSHLNTLTTHTWADGICNVCGTPCDHGGETPTYENGECTVCGTPCDHGGEPPTYTNGFCTTCGEACDHSGSTHATGTPAEDGKHSFTCSVCGDSATEAHSYTSGTCVCGYECKHETYTDSVCDICGAACNHDYTNGICNDCGSYQPATLITADNRGDFDFTDDTYDGYYAISNVGQLIWYGTNNGGSNAVLVSDIQIGTAEAPWVEWGSVEIGSIFDGNGHTVDMHLTYSSVNGEADGRAVGLLSANYKTVRNLILTGSITCNSTYRVGAVSHSGYSTKFENIISYVDITNQSTAPTGGIVGIFGHNGGGSTMTNCAVYANISGENYVGGLVGQGWSGTQYWILTNCAFYGSVTGAEGKTGALVGYSGTTSNLSKVAINNCYYPDGLSAVGGFAGTIGTNDSHAKTAEQFASGEVAWLLNGKSADGVWGQTIGKQAYPVLDGDTVDLGTDCNGNSVYFNGISDGVVHYYSDYGVCADCMALPSGNIAGVYGFSIGLSDQIAMKYHMVLDASVVADSTAKAVFTVTGEDGSYTVEIPVTDLTEENGLYVAACHLAAAEITSEVSVKIISGDTESDSFSYSVVRYADYILADPETYGKEQALVTQLLHYGAAAQIHFDHNTGVLANAGLEEAAQTSIPETAADMTVEGQISGLSFYGASLLFRDRIALRFYFTGSVESITFTAGDKTYTPAAKDKLYCVDITDILPQDLDQQITLTATDAEGNTISVTYGPMNYLVRMNEKGSDSLKALLKALYNYGVSAEEYAILPTIDLSKYENGSVVDITEDCVIIGDGNEYNLSLNIAENATVTFDVGTSGVKLGGQITVADGKTLTLLVAGDAEHTVSGGISLGNSSNVIIEGDLDQTNNKLTVTATNGNAGIGANGGVTAGDITIRNARVDATGSSREAPDIGANASISGAAIGTSDGSMGNILIEKSIIVAAGGYYGNTSHAPAIGIGFVSSTMGNITLKDSQITATNNGDGLASVIGAGANHDVYVSGTLGDIIITNTDLKLSMVVSNINYYAAMIGPGVGRSNAWVDMGKIIFTDVTQAGLDEMIAMWSFPSDFNRYGAYALGRGFNGDYDDIGVFGGVWVSDGNGGTVQIGNRSGYHNPE